MVAQPLDTHRHTSGGEVLIERRSLIRRSIAADVEPDGLVIVTAQAGVARARWCRPGEKVQCCSHPCDTDSETRWPELGRRTAWEAPGSAGAELLTRTVEKKKRTVV